MPPSKDTLNPSTAPNIDNGAAQCPAPITMAPELLNALQVRFKLTEVESQVYAVVLALGQLTEDEIRIYSGLPITKVQGVNKTLQKKQLIKPLPGVVTRYRAFTPYQELAKEVQALSKESEASEKAIQKIQEQIGGDIQTELQSTNRLLETTLENLIERQSIALNEAAMATNIALNNIAENMQKTVTAQAQISTQEFSNQSQALQNTVQEIIERGQAKLQENQSVSVEDIQSALKALQEETEEWIASITDQLLVQSEAISQQAQSHFNDAKLITQKTSESGIKTLTTEITKHKEGMAEIADETATTLVTSIERSNQEIQKTLDNFQKELKQDLSKKIQSITNQIRDTWNQRTQSLDNIIAQMDKALKGENRQRTRTMEKSLTELEATTKSTRETSKQINETLFQQLKKALETGGDQFISLQKEAETTIAQWPPTALNFSQISKIQSNLTTLVEQVKVENERIIKAASEGLGVEMRDTYLAQLLEVQALIKI
ncbi:MAG: helix-turn-helix domain-containing protein, partial [Candidatus Thorarchaeota archaeon]